MYSLLFLCAVGVGRRVCGSESEFQKKAGGDAAKKRRGEGNSGRVANFQESYNKPRHRTPRVETTLENCLGVKKKHRQVFVDEDLESPRNGVFFFVDVHMS